MLLAIPEEIKETNALILLSTFRCLLNLAQSTNVLFLLSTFHCLLNFDQSTNFSHLYQPFSLRPIVPFPASPYWQAPNNTLRPRFQLRGRRSKMVAAGDQKLIFPSPSPPSLPFHLLEVTIISAQDLHPETHRMSTYASAYADPNHKLNTRVDTAGRSNPSWNDKLVFRIDDSFLRSDTSAVTIDIIATTSLRREPVVGTARIVLSALNPSPSTRFVALQVRRPKSLRPQGIINVGVSLLDNYIHSMPLDPAFNLKDVVDSPNRTSPRSSPGLTGNSKVNESDDGFRRSVEPELERNASVEVGPRMVAHEAEVLESKLEKWRTDLSPPRNMNQKKHRRSLTLPSCFCGGPVRE